MAKTNELQVGERVFMVHRRDMEGTVTGVPFLNAKGGWRQAVRWDIGNQVTDWDPVFYRRVGTPDSEIPDRIRSGDWLYVKEAGEIVDTRKLKGIVDAGQGNTPVL